MMLKWIKYSACFLLLVELVACSPSVPEKTEKVDAFPSILPDYIDVTIPQNIAFIDSRYRTGTLFEWTEWFIHHPFKKVA